MNSLGAKQYFSSSVMFDSADFNNSYTSIPENNSSIYLKNLGSTSQITSEIDPNVSNIKVDLKNIDINGYNFIFSGDLFIGGCENYLEQKLYDITLPNKENILNFNTFIQFIRSASLPNLRSIIFFAGIDDISSLSINLYRYKKLSLIDLSDTSITALPSQFLLGFDETSTNYDHAVSLKLPLTLKIIESSTFLGVNFTEITGLQNVEQIDAFAFMQCSIETIPDFANLKQIGDFAFIDSVVMYGDAWPFKETPNINLSFLNNCKNLTNIGNFAFAGVRDLSTSLNLESSIESIGVCAFVKIENLSKINFKNTTSMTNDIVLKDWASSEQEIFDSIKLMLGEGDDAVINQLINYQIKPIYETNKIFINDQNLTITFDDNDTAVKYQGYVDNNQFGWGTESSGIDGIKVKIEYSDVPIDNTPHHLDVQVSGKNINSSYTIQQASETGEVAFNAVVYNNSNSSNDVIQTVSYSLTGVPSGKTIIMNDNVLHWEGLTIGEKFNLVLTVTSTENPSCEKQINLTLSINEPSKFNMLWIYIAIAILALIILIAIISIIVVKKKKDNEYKYPKVKY